MALTPPEKLARIKAWQEANPEKVKAYKRKHRTSPKGVLGCREASRKYAKTATGRFRTAKRREKIRALVAEWKRVPCSDCGGTFPSYCMDFDHRPGTIKEFGIASTGMTYAIKRLEAERLKCDVVCANCHRIRTAERGGWCVQAAGSWR